MRTVLARSGLIGRGQSSVTRIVIHGTSSPCKAGGAAANARWFQQPGARGSAHRVVDPVEIIECVPPTRVAFHAPPNQGSIGWELCDPNAGDPRRWHDANHTAMLDRAAPGIRADAERWGVPLVWLSPAELLAGRHGITSHHNVTLAWRQSTHTDPVGFTPELIMDRLTLRPPTDRNEGRRYAGFKLGDTDTAIWAAGGRDNQVSELEMLFGRTGRQVDGIYDRPLADQVVALKTLAGWRDSRGRPDRSSAVDERFADAVRALHAQHG